MRSRSRMLRRHGGLILESALVYPPMLFLLLGFVICGMAVFRFQQVACLAREAARWASVRGADFQRDTNSESPAQQDILQQVVLPLATGMATEQLTLQVQWIDQGSGIIYDWDSATKDVRSVAASGDYVTNTIRVTVVYQCAPSFFWMSPLDLKSTCEIPMAY
jgi:Flp pilus assembly protein TadG